MKKERIIALFIAMTLVFTLAFTGCGKKDKEDASADGEKTTQAAEETTEAAAATQGQPLTDEFFNDAVFVGDSVTLGLKNHATQERNNGNTCLGNAQFLSEGSMGYSNSRPEIGAANSIHPVYNGTTMYIEDAINAMGAKKVFIMLGMNDFAAYSSEEALANAKDCLTKIAEKNPGIKIYVESVTPTMIENGNFTNANIDIFDNNLKQLCADNGWTYVDVASVMKDATGALNPAYCGDPEAMGLHMSHEGCEAWISYLKSGKF